MAAKMTKKQMGGMHVMQDGSMMKNSMMKKGGAKMTKMQKGGMTGAEMKAKGMALKKAGDAKKAKGQAMKIIGDAKKKVGQDQFLKRAETAQDLINYSTRKGRIQDMDPAVLAGLKAKVNRASEIKKERASKTYKTGGMVNANSSVKKQTVPGSKGVKAGINPSAKASKVARGRVGGTSKAPKNATPKK
jgi:hypothetical protein